ncbi:DUF3299 domain-containing protein [Paraglaciecola sp. 2405UD69-4]|uniref:DUF3299 domain-containing protein n=1 Tax=Paraglaciecola sp. 2405UD69-4 TaxID=3391836 RepID=UPI0039C8FF8F
MNSKNVHGLLHFSTVLFTMLWFALTSTAIAATQDYQEVEWIELMPQDDLDALLNPPDYLSGIQDGSEQDSVDALSSMTTQDSTTQRFQQALTSVRVIDEFDNKSIKIPGFVVPLKSDEQQRVTEFFIVPYFGACLHMPPPPPNQMIHGKVEEGFELAQLTEPFWFEGVLHIETMSNATGTSAYGMTLDNIQAYE